ncbi:MAG: UvrD-helicase domain-containing protein [Lachnospiraceae bacterium]|jgi:DNA helicase-2/ATP-dependent DNA helicase PcrA|nr:UvrD-helicase domain-containing protein [Lachnospiraceae bacterium]
MSRGTEYLTFVTGILKERIQEIGAKIREVQKDIEHMHDYYWENYTEMDQYGYENFDNQQALLAQVNANTENQRMYRRMKRLLESPFFGRVDFVYEDEEEPEHFYIGLGNFSEKTGRVPLIYDWRAPVSGLFYDYDKGAASYEAPGGRLEGEILSKWQYKIREGRMIYEFESDTKIDDDILKQELGANSDTQLKNIVRTIQKEQNAIIRNTKDRILVIQGAAGSGKTSIALHRIAYLLYHDRDRLRSSNVLVLSPNSVFSDYISHVLPELGEENIQEMSFDLFAYRELQDVASDCEDRYHYIEHQIRHGKSENYEWKQSKQYMQAVEGFLIELEDRLVDFAEIEYRGFGKSAEELTRLFYYKFLDTPLLKRMEALMDYFVDEYETLRGKTLAEEALEQLRERFMGLYVTTDIYKIYNWFLEEQGLPVLEWAPREQRILEYEDVYPILYLKQRLSGAGNRKNIRHLVIDEMQDYSYLQYVILGQMFSCSMTILGDRAQTVDGGAKDVQRFLPEIYGRTVRCIELNKSYRNTIEIASYAQKLTGLTGIEYLKRHGKPVTESGFSSMEEAMEEVLRCSALGEEGYETAAVLTMTEADAKACFAYLKERENSVFYIDRDSTAFQKGITVTTFYQAKGLEFDQVFVVGGDRKNDFFIAFRYISATRALHELYVFEVS